MEEWIDSCGVVFMANVRMTQSHIYYGSDLYSRWYGYYKLDNRMMHKLKMAIKNG